MIKRKGYCIDAQVKPIGLKSTWNYGDSLDPKKHRLFYVWYYPDYEKESSKTGMTEAIAGKTPEECVDACFRGYSSRDRRAAFMCKEIFLVPAFWKGKTYTDKMFHKFLRQQGIPKTNKMRSNEHYECRHDQIELHLRNQLEGIERIDRPAHTLQRETLNQAVNIIDNCKQDDVYIVGDMCPRSGKTTWGLDLFLDRIINGGSEIAIIPAYWLSALTSAAQEISSLARYVNLVWIDARDNPTYELEIEQAWKDGKYPVIGISLCGDESATKYLSLSYIPRQLKVILGDEVDFGTHTKKSQIILKKIIG